MPQNPNIRALVPVFVTPPPVKDIHNSLTNNFSLASCDLSESVNLADDISRILAVKSAMNKIKKSLVVPAALWIAKTLLPCLPSALNRSTVQKIFSRHGLIFSNVRGPDAPAHIGESKVLQVYGIFKNVIDQVILVSYDGYIFLNLALDDAKWKHVEDIEPMFLEALEAMENARFAM